MNRDDALVLLKNHTKTDSLRKHALGVEAAMRAYAPIYDADVEKWGIVGLLHDFDYEETPDPKDHPLRGAAILQDNGYPEDVIYAIKSHATYLGLPRSSPMDKALFAVDELVGFAVAVALVRPSKSILDVKVSSVKKKMKQVGFARAVSREDIIEGAESLGLSLDDHVAATIDALKSIASELGLDGQAVDAK
ncbi:MAG: HDIG domain-containing protein [Candidatus Latescibacteria bacterium]|nr:HDIG domain-containing protein [Candidatus Latescibacterota bacterium]